MADEFNTFAFISQRDALFVSLHNFSFSYKVNFKHVEVNFAVSSFHYCIK